MKKSKNYIFDEITKRNKEMKYISTTEIDELMKKLIKENKSSKYR